MYLKVPGIRFLIYEKNQFISISSPTRFLIYFRTEPVPAFNFFEYWKPQWFWYNSTCGFLVCSRYENSNWSQYLTVPVLSFFSYGSPYPYFVASSTENVLIYLLVSVFRFIHYGKCQCLPVPVWVLSFRKPHSYILLPHVWEPIVSLMYLLVVVFRFFQYRKQ